MNALVTGASGLVGSALSAALESNGHSVTKLSRSSTAGPTWDPAGGKMDLHSAPPIDVVIHLAGENIGARWTTGRKRRIRESRVAGTQLLSETLARLPTRPEALVCASAVGFYGDRGADWMDEGSRGGVGFLAEVCRDWEEATAPAAAAGIRVAQLRLGIILARQGGALAKMLPAFRLGLGGRLGDGRQYWSWITLEDVVQAIQHVMAHPGLRGPVNVTAPHPATNREFASALGAVLHRPTFFAMPRFAVSVVFGEMGREAILASTRARPARLLETGFRFGNPDLEGALRGVVG